MSQRYPPIAWLGACESARGLDADRHVKLLIQFEVEGSLSGAYSQTGPMGCFFHNVASKKNSVAKRQTVDARNRDVLLRPARAEKAIQL